MKMSPGKYLLITSAIYLVVGIFDIWVYRFIEPEIAQVIFIAILCLPLLFRPIARWAGMKVIGE